MIQLITPAQASAAYAANNQPDAHWQREDQLYRAAAPVLHMYIDGLIAFDEMMAELKACEKLAG